MRQMHSVIVSIILAGMLISSAMSPSLATRSQNDFHKKKLTKKMHTKNDVSRITKRGTYTKNTHKNSAPKHHNHSLITPNREAYDEKHDTEKR